MTPDSTDAGTRVMKTAGDASIAHGLLRRLAGMKPDQRIERSGFEAGDVLFGIQQPVNY